MRSALPQCEKHRAVYRVQVLGRVFDIIDALAEHSSELTLADFSRKLHLHRSTVHRLLKVLEGNRYVERVPANGKYRLGSKLLELGTKVSARLDLPAIAWPFLEQVVRETRETAHMGTLRQGEVVSIANVESSRTLHTPSTVGRRTPAHCSSQGKCLLAFLPDADLADFVRTKGLQAFTANTITRPAALKTELRRVRERGYAVDEEEFEEGLKCLGAPVRNHSGEVVAAISIAGPAARLGPSRMPALMGSVVKAATALSAALGYLYVSTEGRANDIDSVVLARNTGPERKSGLSQRLVFADDTSAAS